MVNHPPASPQFKAALFDPNGSNWQTYLLLSISVEIFMKFYIDSLKTHLVFMKITVHPFVTISIELVVSQCLISSTVIWHSPLFKIIIVYKMHLSVLTSVNKSPDLTPLDFVL